MKNVVLLFLLTFCLCGCSNGQTVFRQNRQAAIPADDELRSEFVKLNQALAGIISSYVDTVNTRRLVEDAITGMLEKLDPHSNYMTVEEVKEMNEPLQGSFDGIGIQFNMLTDTLNVVQVIPGGPSEKVGLMVGDKIISVNDTVIAGVKFKNTDIMKRLRGPKGTTVNIKILRNRNPQLLDFSIVRDKIPVFSLSSSYMIDSQTGYIKLNRFAATTHEEFVEAITRLREQGMQHLILDLQANGGGYLGAAISIANEFLRRGSLIVYTEGTHQPRENAEASASGRLEDGRLVVLVDESSASASEIVSGAIQDWDRGVIVGRRTYGKGLVQRPISLPDGSMLRLTTARYYTPTGRSIQKPYENGKIEEYNREVINRYNRGELLSADSIHFPDSLKYSTLTNHRTVYGGGGIMPDYFVPLDTTFSSRMLREMSAFGIVAKYVQNHLDANRNEYKTKYPDFDTYRRRFTVSDSMIDAIVAFYRIDREKMWSEITADSISRTDELDLRADDSPGKAPTDEQIRADLAKSGNVIRAQIKSLIARDLFSENEYYQIINNEISAYREAIRIIGNEKVYNALLKN